MEMVWVLDRSHKTIKDCWHSSGILKGINNINTAWKVASKKCLKGVCHKRLTQSVLVFTGIEPVVNSIDDVNRTSQEAGLDEVIGEDITQLLHIQGQQLSQQKEEEKEKEVQPPLKCMKTSDLQHSFSAMEILTDELWHWLWKGKKGESKNSVMVLICPYSEIHKERIRNLDSQHFIFS